MKKSDAIHLLGGNNVEAAKAIGITKQAIGQWPDELPQRQQDLVIGAAIRLGIPVPDEYRGQSDAAA